ncbi:MAG: hypothetical protein A2Y33_05320 [Spirochaetes bacterium GWF1_51_8]|nr:MAG: hypothetical protein A2Y33_05320 [Spirochaetes bacterium GWF1_51_8]
MKKIFLVIIAAVVTSCGAVRPDLPPNKAGFVYGNIPDLTPANFESYTLELQPYEYKIIKISNYADPKEFDGTPGWWKDAVCYQLYVRSYYDSDGNGVGDFKGLIERLDYITNLGANVIWTLPVFKSLHDGGIGRALGYEAIDYYAVDPDYGTMDEWKAYVDKAHKLGIKVIMDMVINHNATNSEWFMASELGDPKYKDWYIWSKTIPAGAWGVPWGGGKPTDVWHLSKTNGKYWYATWGGELNFNNPAVRAEFMKIASYWLDLGADGYRLDAIRYLIEEGPGALQADTASTLKYMKEFQANIKKKNPSAMTVGEVWESDKIVGKYYMGGEGFDQCFSFAFMYTVRNALSSGKKFDFINMLKGRPKDVPFYYYANFVENHDVPRLVDAVGKDWGRLKAAAAILMTFQGTPWVYHGTEIALSGSYSTMKWDSGNAGGFSSGKAWNSAGGTSKANNIAAFKADPDSLWNEYQTLIALRKSEPALQRGSMKLIATDENNILAYLRTGKDDSIVVVVNLSKTATSVNLNFSGTGLNVSNTYFLYNLK